MVTPAANGSPPDDLAIPDHGAVGLPAPSVIRCAKIATINPFLAEPLGHLSPGLLAQVRARAAGILSPRTP